MKDQGILLFGKKIGSSESSKIPNLRPFSTAGEVAGGGGHGLMVDEKIYDEEERLNREEAEKAYSSSSSRDSHTPSTPYDQTNNEPKPEDKSSSTAVAEAENTPKTPSIEEDTTLERPQETGNETNSQPKTPQKPERILPCPRCDSMDTKFCYYNNCNINQPRHFCKSCQRYWTAGGTMRNMLVGAGRRKRKIPATATQIEVAADSAAVHTSVSFSCTSEPNATTLSSPPENTTEHNGPFSQAYPVPVAPWFYNSATPFPAVCPTGYPLVPIYPSPYWNCVPWLPMHTQTAQPNPSNSSVLGKHSRNEDIRTSNGCEEVPRKQRNSVLIPKTLRIDDPDEAAKSSIWATLGIKNENTSRGSLFKAFQAKGGEKKKDAPTTTTSLVLQSNPAALSRSIRFQETA